jgi:3-oxoadipate enol-lactonase
LNEIPRSNGSPAMSFPRSEAITTAIRSKGRIEAVRQPAHPPAPPIEMPPARTVRIPDRGEFFLRDSGGEGPVVMLLHGWMASADLNWWGAYGDLIDAGYRVLAIDHRGHGRGLRPLVPFRLSGCAADAAAVLRELGAAPAVVVGYSMGGAVAQLVAHEQPDVVAGLVLSGTAQHWQDPPTRRRFKLLGLMGLMLSIAPRATYRAGLRRAGIREDQRTTWLQSELIRHSATDIAEAGRELGRFDSRAWLHTVKAPVAVVVTTRDELVPVRKQRQLAAAAGAQVFESPISHMEAGWNRTFNAALLEAIGAVSGAAVDIRAA